MLNIHVNHMMIREQPWETNS